MNNAGTRSAVQAGVPNPGWGDQLLIIAPQRGQ